MKMNARPGTMIAIAIAFVVFTVVAAPAFAQANLAPALAHQRANSGEILLVDIRQVSEWRETGVAASATLISMHETGFFDKLDAAVDGDHSRTVALICAVGGRSTWMQAQLLGRGYTNIVNVIEGMVGGRYGPGWISRGLPTAIYTE